MEGIDIVVVNYQTPEDLRGFCASLFTHLPETPCTLWIMNNDPNDIDSKTAQVCQANSNVEDCRILEGENIYYSGACNVAAAASGREVIAFFNADTRFLAGTVDKCYRALMDNPEWGVLGPFQRGDRGEVTHAGIFGTLKSPAHRGWAARLKDPSEFYDVQEAVTVSGSAYFTKREVWDKLTNCELYAEMFPNVGAFLPTTHYYEETWYSYHAQAHGYKVVYFGEAQMIHRFHKSSPQGGWADRQMPASRKMFRAMCDHHQIPHD